jgi:hypothetical protein
MNDRAHRRSRPRGDSRSMASRKVKLALGRLMMVAASVCFTVEAVEARIETVLARPSDPATPDDPTPAPGASAAPAPDAPLQTEPEAVGRTVQIQGRALDAETGEPVTGIIVQAGKFDLEDPSRVTWGYSEGRSSARDGSFSTSVRWTDGWTARVVVDGYLPAPVITAAPPEGVESLDVTLRLVRGTLILGRVLDPDREPVIGASVFAVGPTSINLAAGKAWDSLGNEDSTAKPVFTDANGRFELPAGAATSIAVSSSGLDLWPAALPESGEVEVVLPKPARLEISYDIDGADDESRVFYQLLTHAMTGFENVRSSRELTITKGTLLTLPALVPGKYQICRQKMIRLGEIGIGAMLDREFIELAPGESRELSFTRDKNAGARLRGRVVVPEGVELLGIIVSVYTEETYKGPFDDHEWQTKLDSRPTGEAGSFLTERIPPGRHVIRVDAWVPLTEDQRRSTGLLGPAWRAETVIDVPQESPESGELEIADLILSKV